MCASRLRAFDADDVVTLVSDARDVGREEGREREAPVDDAGFGVFFLTTFCDMMTSSRFIVVEDGDVTDAVKLFSRDVTGLFFCFCFS